MSRERGAKLSSEGRSALSRLVARQKSASVQAPAAAPAPAAGTAQAKWVDFTTLPGFREMTIQAAMADAIGLRSPFFLEHQTRAGATTVIDGVVKDNFSSYDYLGFNGHPRVSRAAEEAIGRFGTSVSASRLVAGERPLHRALETAIARHYAAEDCVVFVSGHATNVGTIGALMGPRDLIVHDAFAHNSILVGAGLSRAERRSFPHNDLAALDALLGRLRNRYERALIVVEGLYSMDGDFPDLAELVAIKRRHGAWLMVDEAHALGVVGRAGRGLFEECGVDPGEVDIWMGTLSKTLAACGGYVAGCKPLVDFIKYSAGAFVYSVGLSPPVAAAAAESMKLLGEEPERVARLRANGRLFVETARAAGLDVGTSAGLAVVPVIVGDSLLAVALSQRLAARGINVQPIIHPAVPERSSRLRFFITCEHTPEQIARAIDATRRELAHLGSSQAILANPALLRT